MGKMEQMPAHVRDAILRHDTEALQKMSSAGGKATAKLNQEKSALRDAAEIKKEELATQEKMETLAVQNMHRTDAEGDVLPPEDTEVWH